jgi:hypothetical protein
MRRTPHIDPEPAPTEATEVRPRTDKTAFEKQDNEASFRAGTHSKRRTMHKA